MRGADRASGKSASTRQQQRGPAGADLMIEEVAKGDHLIPLLVDGFFRYFQVQHDFGSAIRFFTRVHNPAGCVELWKVLAGHAELATRLGFRFFA